MGNNFIAIKNRQGSLLEVKGYNTFNNQWFDDEYILLTSPQDINVSNPSDYLLFFYKNTPIRIIKKDDFNNRTIKMGSMNYKFNDDGTFIVSYENEKMEPKKGTWSIIDNKVLFLIFDNQIKSYIVFIGPRMIQAYSDSKDLFNVGMAHTTIDNK